jgi:endonuclease/exonuclease/phosphatase family metal-dependent hydrolase
VSERRLILWSHNAYWFQGAPSLWGEERQVSHPEALAALTSLSVSLRPDVLLLQEVSDAEVAAELGDRLGMHSNFAVGGERPAYGGSIFWHKDLEGHVEDLTACWTAAGSRFERICMHLALIIDGHELRVINVHLSSNRFVPGRLGEPVRLGELDTAFREVACPDIVAGDFNARADSGVYGAMTQRGYRDPHHDDPRQLVDYVWIHTDSGHQATALVAPARFEVPGHTGTALSDHTPVGVEIALTE